jgi:hypothetical protein
MAGYEITCVNKNRSGSLVRIGGDQWSLSVHEAIVNLLSGQLRLSIMIGGQMLEVGIRGDGPDAYLALEPEGFALHDLTDLPSCFGNF